MAVGHTETTVRVRPYLASSALILFVVAVMVVAAVALPLILVLPWLEMLRGSRPLDVFTLCVVPPLLAFVIFIAYRFARGAPGFFKPDVFTEQGFTISGESYSWKIVDKVFLNPRLKYVTILYKRLISEYSAGTIVERDRCEPSFAAFIDILRSQKIPLDEFTEFSLKQLNVLREKWRKESGS